MQAALTGPLEIATISPETEALRVAVAPLVFGALLLVVVAVFIRVAIGQASRRSIARCGGGGRGVGSGRGIYDGRKERGGHDTEAVK